MFLSVFEIVIETDVIISSLESANVQKSYQMGLLLSAVTVSNAQPLSCVMAVESAGRIDEI